jgi:hypothetical protein
LLRAPGSPFMHVLPAPLAQTRRGGTKRKHRTGAQGRSASHIAPFDYLGRVGCHCTIAQKLPPRARSTERRRRISSLSLPCPRISSSHGIFLASPILVAGAGAGAGDRSIPWSLQCLPAVEHPSALPYCPFLLFARPRSRRFIPPLLTHVDICVRFVLM